MKPSLLFLLFLFYFWGGISQNIMFQPFNISYEKTVAELRLLNVDSIEQASANYPLTAYYDGFIAKYYFNDQRRLYRIETCKNYTQSKIMYEAVEGATEYFEKIRAKMHYVSKGKAKSYKAKRKGLTYTLNLNIYAENDYFLTLEGENEALAPGVEDWMQDDPMVSKSIEDINNTEKNKKASRWQTLRMGKQEKREE